jgi:hypothetical protein
MHPCQAAAHLRYDAAAWERRFVGLWPEGTEAHLSYFERIRQGPAFERAA